MGKVCFICEKTSHEKALVSIEKDGDSKFVCVWCLPTLIHGAK